MTSPNGLWMTNSFQGHFIDANTSEDGHASTAPVGRFPVNGYGLQDVARASTFYGAVFGWRFESWGPPGFYLIPDVGQGNSSALRERRELLPGQRLTTFETTLAVDDMVTSRAAVIANGGRVLMQPYRIEEVGEIGYFEDTEGNVCGVGQYDRDRRR